MAAGRYDTIAQKRIGSVVQLSYGWTSHASTGNVSISQAEAVSLAVPSLRGRVERVILDPDSGGTAPSANYDVTLLDDDSADILNAEGTDSDATNGNDYRLATPVPVDGVLRLQVTNAGNSKGGTVKIYYQRGD